MSCSSCPSGSYNIMVFSQEIRMWSPDLNLTSIRKVGFIVKRDTNHNKDLIQVMQFHAYLWHGHEQNKQEYGENVSYMCIYLLYLQLLVPKTYFITIAYTCTTSVHKSIGIKYYLQYKV